MSDTLNPTAPTAAVHQPALIPLPEEIPAVTAFINERPNFVTALHAAVDSADYSRWAGHAAARRQLAQALGWTVPHEPGETTALTT